MSSINWKEQFDFTPRSDAIFCCCFWCKMNSSQEKLTQIGFAVAKEDSCFKGYTGGWIHYRFVCLDCGSRIKKIVDTWLEEAKT